MSFIILLLSIAVGAYGYFSIGGRTFNPPQVATYKFKWTVNPNAALGILCIGGAIFGLLMSCLGFTVQKCKCWFFAILYGILSFIAGLLALAFGAAIVSGGYTTQVKDLICKSGGSTYLYNHYKNYVDTKMCSNTAGCKCSPANKAQWETAASTKTAAWRATGRLASSLDFTGTVTSYSPSCYDALVKSYSSGSSANKNDALEFLTKGGFKFIQSFEKQFKCAGVCFTPMFYLSRPLSDGIPTTSCDTAFLKSVSGQIGPAVVSFVTAIIMLSLFGATFTQCSGESDPNDAMGGA